MINYTPQYLRLNKGGAYARLGILRGIVAIANASHKPPSLIPATWREARRYGFGNWRAAYCDMSQGLNDNKPVWYAHTGEQFRDERDYREIVTSARHTGYYCDTEQSGLAIGIVGRLTHGRFIAGYRLTDNGERVYFGEVFTDEREAADMADEHARIIGEAELENAEQYREAQNLESETEAAFSRLRECLALRHKACMKYARDEVSALVRTIRNNRETLRTRYAGIL